jgi:hypothetical protein
MPEGKDDKAPLVPEFLGVLLTKVFLPDGQGEKAENPDVDSGDDLKKNFILPSPWFHKGLHSKSAKGKSSKKAFSEIPPVLPFSKGGEPLMNPIRGSALSPVGKGKL